MSTATAVAIDNSIIAAIESTPASASRLMRVRELWESSKQSQLEIGRLLYEEREERLGVGGRGTREGFHQWLRDAGIPKTSAYRRIAEYEISIGVRAEEPEDKAVPSGTTILQRAIDVEGKEALYQLRAAIDRRLHPEKSVPDVKPEIDKAVPSEASVEFESMTGELDSTVNEVQRDAVVVGQVYGGNWKVWERSDTEAADGSKVWLVENLEKGLPELWRTHEILNIVRKGKARHSVGIELWYNHDTTSEEKTAAWQRYRRFQLIEAAIRLCELKGEMDDLRELKGIGRVDDIVGSAQ